MDPVRDGDVKTFRHRNGTGDPRCALATDTRFPDSPHFFPSASEHKGIAAFQTENQRMGLGQGNEELVDFLLCHAVKAFAFSRVDPLCIRIDIQDVLRNQVVIDDHVCPSDQVQHLQGQQFPAAASGSCQNHRSRLLSDFCDCVLFHIQASRAAETMPCTAVILAERPAVVRPETAARDGVCFAAAR